MNTIIPLQAKGDIGEYKLLYHTSDSKPWAIFKRTRGFWQQISKNYFRKGNALRYATRNNIKLSNI